MEKRRVLIVDHCPLVRVGLASLIEREIDLTVCGDAGNCEQGLRALAAHRPNAVTLELAMPERSGLELIKDMLIQHPAVAVLVVSRHGHVSYINSAFHTGAHGYMTKDEAPHKLAAAIRTVLVGKRYLSTCLAVNLAHQTLDDDNRNGSCADHLSSRELEVFEMLGRGCAISEIAAAYHLSISTVHTYCGRMREKMSVRTERELLVAAVRWSEQQRPRAFPTNC